jgi:hypothetical protein
MKVSPSTLLPYDENLQDVSDITYRRFSLTPASVSGTLWRSLLRQYVTSGKVASSKPDEMNGLFFQFT